MKPFFRKPKPYHNSAAQKAAQQSHIRQYFDDVDLNKPANADGRFNSSEVYARVIENIEASNGRSAARRKRWVAAAGLTGFLLVSAAAVYLLRVQAPVSYKVLATANGQLSQVTLGDGTQVWLNSGSRLRYPEEFRGAKREVTLQGEAFFDVKHDAAHPFLVHSGKITTQVLGTSFNIKAYAADPVMKVDVVTGKVGVINQVQKAAPTLILTPNQEAVYDAKHAALYKNERAEGVVLSSWKDGKLVFKNQLLPEVLNALQRRFSIRLSADDNLHQCAISADFTGVALPDILTILSRLVKGKVTQSQAVYQLHGKGC
jgi:transmembrane sensor